MDGGYGGQENGGVAELWQSPDQQQSLSNPAGKQRKSKLTDQPLTARAKQARGKQEPRHDWRAAHSKGPKGARGRISSGEPKAAQKATYA